jgi:hypothetical protein
LQFPELSDIVLNNDFVLFTETWTSPISDSSLGVNDFEFISIHRTLEKKTAKWDSGGLVLYYMSSFAEGVSLYQRDCDDTVWIKLKSSREGFC